MAAKRFRFAGLQLLVGADKEANLARARHLIAQAVANGARLISLPVRPHSHIDAFASADYTESIALTSGCAGVLQLPLLERLFPYVCRASPRRAFGGHAARGCPQALCVPRWRCACPRPSSLTHSEGVGLTQRMCHDAGSIPEREGDKLYNTSVVYDPQGNLIAKHRKVWSLSTKCLLEPPLMNESFLQLHLFDINVPPGEGRPGMTFKYVATQSLSSCGSWSLTLLVRWAGNQTRFRPEATSPPLQQVPATRLFLSSTRGSSCADLVHCHATLLRVV